MAAFGQLGERRGLGALGLLLALGACASVPERTVMLVMRSEIHVAAFSWSGPEGEFPDGWAPWLIDPRKPQTHYALVRKDGAVVVHAQAAASVSGLIRRMVIDPVAHPMLRWRWRVEQLVEHASALDAVREDAPARILIAFDGDHAQLDPLERDRLALARVLSGSDMPYATLMYIWSNDQSAESVVPNPRTSRVQMVVVEQGAQRVGRWLDYERDVVADFRRAFGEEPGPISAVGVLTDADDTRSAASAYYGDIALRPRKAADAR